MKILFIHLAREGNVEYRITEDLATYANPSEIESLFVLQSKEIRAPGKIMEENGRIHKITIDSGRLMDLSPKPNKFQRAWMMAIRFPATIKLLMQMVHQFHPDFIYSTQQQYDAFLGNLLSRITHVPYLLHLEYPVGPWLGKPAIWGMTRAECVLACSEFVKKTAINFGISASKIKVVLNPVNIDKFDIPRDPKYVRQAFGLSENAQVVVSAGRLDPTKNQHLTIEAFSQIIGTFPDAKLIICGTAFLSQGSGYEEYIHNLVEQKGLQKRVIFAGLRNDLPQIFAGSQIFCLPTEHEAFGQVFTEAMISRLPVVAIQSGAVPEIVVDGQTGLLSPAGDATMLAKLIIQLLSDSGLAMRMGEAGYQRAKTLFLPTKISHEWTTILKDFLTERERHSKLLN